MKHGAAAPQIVDCEGMAEGVKRAGRGSESEPFAEELHVPQDHSSAQLRLSAACEEQLILVQSQVRRVAVQRLPQRERDGNDSLLPPLAVQGDEQIVQIYFPNPKSERLA